MKIVPLLPPEFLPPAPTVEAIRLHIRIVLNDVGDDILMPNHIVERYALRAFGAAQQQPRCRRWE